MTNATKNDLSEPWANVYWCPGGNYTPTHPEEILTRGGNKLLNLPPHISLKQAQRIADQLNLETKGSFGNYHALIEFFSEGTKFGVGTAPNAITSYSRKDTLNLLSLPENLLLKLDMESLLEYRDEAILWGMGESYQMFELPLGSAEPKTISDYAGLEHCIVGEARWSQKLFRVVVERDKDKSTSKN